LPDASGAPLPRRNCPIDRSTYRLPVWVHGLIDATVMFVPGDPMAGDAVNVRRFGGLRVVVVVDLGVVVVTARVVVVDARVVVVVPAVGAVVVVWAWAAYPTATATTNPTRTPSTSCARRTTLMSHLRRAAKDPTQPFA